MSDQPPAAQPQKQPAVAKPLRSKIGLELQVIGPGETITAKDRAPVETVRVRRKDGGIRDIPRSELETVNSKAAVAAALEHAAKQPPAAE